MASETEPARPTLLTFAPMVDSETSRLLLAHYGIAYRERDHLLQRAAPTTLFYGGIVQIPLLYGRGLRLTGPRAISRYYEALAAPEYRLVPGDGEAAQVEKDWETYNGGLALHTAVFAYHHLLPLRELMSGIFAAPLAPGEAKYVRADYAMMEFFLRLGLRPTAARAANALEQIRAIFAQTDARVADGRRYLCGDRLTFGDLALASASAPLLQPPGYGAKMPAVELLPTTLRKAVRELQSHPTAAFVKRLYAEGMPAGRVG